MKTDSKGDPRRERELIIYQWLLQHNWRKADITTPMQAWSSKITAMERGQFVLDRR